MDTYNLIGFDIIEGLDNNFYLTDVNGGIGFTAMKKYNKHLKKNYLLFSILKK